MAHPAGEVNVQDTSSQFMETTSNHFVSNIPFLSTLVMQHILAIFGKYVKQTIARNGNTRF